MSWSPCSDRTAPARRRRSRSSRAIGAPTPAGSRVLGIDPATGGRALRSRVGPHAPVRRDRPSGAAARDAPPVRRASTPTRATRTNSSTLVGLQAVARTRYRRLSGGERQRLGLALALVGRPEVLVLDEPTAGMDPEARAATRAIVADLRDDGAGILLTSHDLADVERLADRICIIDDGRLVASGTPGRAGGGLGATPPLPARSGARRARRSPTCERHLRATAPGRDRRRRRRRRTLSSRRSPPRTRSIVGALAGWCAAADRLIVELRTAGGSLEEVYLELVGHEREADA